MEPQPQPEGDALVGTVLGERYRIDELVGEGGMGKVYLGHHTMMRKRIAVKVIHPDLTHVDEVVARFAREAVAAAHIEHPNAVAATDFGKTASGALYLVMEYVDGRPLDGEMKQTPLFPAARVVHIGRQVLRALRRAHALGIVHRDIKPDNVTLVERDGDRDFVKVLDFGIAKMTLPEGESNPLTQIGMVYGTPEYMSPEQATGSAVDARADLYSVGILMYEMLCGRRPFEGTNAVALLGQHVTATPPRPSRIAPEASIPAALEELILKLLAKLPGQRYQSAGEVLEALDQIEALAEPGLAATHHAERSLHASPRDLPWLESAADFAVVTRRALARSGRRLREEARRSPRRAWVVVGSAAAVIGMGTLLLSIDGDPGSDPANPDQPEEAMPVRTPSPSPAAAVQEARPAATTARSGGGDALMQYTLGSTLSDADELGTAVAHYEAALELDPRYKEDEKLRQDLVRALGDRRAAEVARNVLRLRVGARAVDELAAAAGSRKPLLRRNARSLLEEIVPSDRFPAYMRDVDALRTATTCAARKQVVVHLRELGDARALPSLQALRDQHGGCGIFGLSDCNDCLRPELAGAIHDLQARAQESAR